MDRLSIEKLYRKAEVFAVKIGKAHLADDFKSWYIIKVLEGKSTNQLMRYSFIDFLRQEVLPASRSNRGAIQQALTPERQQSVDDQIDAIAFIEKYLGTTESVMCYLLAIEGYTIKEIGKMYGKSEGRISQMFTKIGKKNSKIRKNNHNKEG